MMRRLRRNSGIRDLIAETKICLDDFVMPFFVVEGNNIIQEISSFPGIFRYSVDNLVKEIKRIWELGIKSVILFGVVDECNKDALGSYAIRDNNVVCKAIKLIKDKVPEVIVISDVCLCSYTSSGHCGIVDNGIVDNSKTVEILSKVALNYAKSGADIVAPSAMADFQVREIRKVLYENGFDNTLIMSYSAKYSSNFYGPFRDIANSSPKFGDRKTYQMDYRNIKQALVEVERDIQEGVDIVMVKPALAYLDVIREVKNTFNIPLAAYSVSGEYSMVKVASQCGILNEKETALEILMSIKRAGADIIISYWAKDLPGWI
ncbi:MAG: porphobilinogen synthase [Brevinematales bacterium]|nr:porphobilinogen synthase [Brevinematales bacterium]